MQKQHFSQIKQAVQFLEKKFKRKFMVLGRVLAYFPYTNEGQPGLDLYRKNRLKLVQKHEFSLNFFFQKLYSSFYLRKMFFFA